MKLNFIILSIFLFFISINLQSQDKIPNVTLKTLEGKQIDIKDAISSNGPTVISFWATWCKPCIKELTAFMDYAIDLEEELGVKVLAVSIDDSRNSARVAPLVQGQGWEYTVLLDENQDLKRNLGIVNVPFTLVSKGSKIIYRKIGYKPGEENDLYEIILI